MEIFKWIGDGMSAKSIHAVVQVEAGEIADVEQMLKLLDGDNKEHFGLTASLVATNNPPEFGFQGRPKIQFGFNGAVTLLKKKRYYEVWVYRD